jgi:hypothetical protein
MSYIVLKAYRQLILFDLHLVRGKFAVLRDKVHRQAISNTWKRSYSIEQICHAVDVACIWYWKQVLCLQRSAATASLLKRQGFNAKMVVGVQQLPFRAHAWVEVNGRVVNDKTHTLTTYAVLDEC